MYLPRTQNCIIANIVNKVSVKLSNKTDCRLKLIPLKRYHWIGGDHKMILQPPLALSYCDKRDALSTATKARFGEPQMSLCALQIMRTLAIFQVEAT